MLWHTLLSMSLSIARTGIFYQHILIGGRTFPLTVVGFPQGTAWDKEVLLVKQEAACA
jgi:hypothetical protein